VNPFPEDIFTEPENVDPDTLANLGPLRRLAGVWQSSKGVDLAPKAPGPERREYIERIDMQPIDPQANGPQLFYGLRYHLHINTEEEDITFHDQVGYWLWDAETGLVMQSLTIPRGQTNYGICSTDFLEYAFRTDSYRLEITFNPDGSWSYISDTMLKVRGQEELFRHRDRNTLVKVAEPKPNPLMLIVSSRKPAQPD